jgi:hypothetical protein
MLMFVSLLLNLEMPQEAALCHFTERDPQTVADGFGQCLMRRAGKDGNVSHLALYYIWLVVVSKNYTLTAADLANQRIIVPFKLR